MIVQVCPSFLTKCKSLSVSKYLIEEVKLKIKTIFSSLSLGGTGKNFGQEQGTCLVIMWYFHISVLSMW